MGKPKVTKYDKHTSKQFDKSFTNINRCTINCALDFVNIKINTWM